MATSFFTQLPATRQPDKMNDIVEVDESYFLGSFKGPRRLAPVCTQAWRQSYQERYSTEQVPLLVGRDRHGETADLF